MVNKNVVNFQLTGSKFHIGHEDGYEVARLDKGDLNKDDIALLNSLLYAYFRFRALEIGDDIFVISTLTDLPGYIEYNEFWSITGNSVIMSIRRYDLYSDNIDEVIKKFYEGRHKNIDNIKEALTKEEYRKKFRSLFNL